LDDIIAFGYTGMFVVAFLAATILPLSSELVLTGLAINGLSWPLLLFVASLGNVLGATVNYVIGVRYGQPVSMKLLRVSQRSFQRAEHWYQKWGRWSLLLSWVPIIGDPLTLLAGILRTRFWFFFIVVSVAKTARYSALLYMLNR